MTLPDDDLAPLEPPEALIGIWSGAVASGSLVFKMPATNPALAPELDCVGFPGHGWYVRMRDAYGTVVWSIMLKGLADPPGIEASDGA